MIPLPLDKALLIELASAMSIAYYGGGQPAWQNANKTAHVFSMVIRNTPTILWEGTTDVAEWLEDFDPLVQCDPNGPPIGKVHAPSLENVLEILPHITAYLDSIGKPEIYIVGHSKGAREAPVCHAMLKFKGYPVRLGFYMEPPRAGGLELKNYLLDQAILGTCTHNNKGKDIVTTVPFGPDWMQVCTLLGLTVPDNYGPSAKHVIGGVLAGLRAWDGQSLVAV